MNHKTCSDVLSRHVVRLVAATLGFTAVLGAATAHADDASTALTSTETAPSSALGAVSSPAPSAWSAASHAGFAMVDRSSTGFNQVAGTLLYFDAGSAIGPADFGLTLGIRTLAQGGQGRQSDFYRMGSGPLVSWQADETWSFSAAFGLFKEAVIKHGGSEEYGSRGRTWMLGWERVLVARGPAHLMWGGFWTYHSGSVEATAAQRASLATAAASLPDRNVSVSHGLDLGFSVSL